MIHILIVLHVFIVSLFILPFSCSWLVELFASMSLEHNRQCFNLSLVLYRTVLICHNFNQCPESFNIEVQAWMFVAEPKPAMMTTEKLLDSVGLGMTVYGIKPSSIHLLLLLLLIIIMLFFCFQWFLCSIFSCSLVYLRLVKKSTLTWTLSSIFCHIHA